MDGGAGQVAGEAASQHAGGGTQSDKVAWSELLPHAFKARLAERPLVYLPLGLCEPHGQISAFGLDTRKAEHLCYTVARSHGGIVAPTHEYHIHENGPSAGFLEANIGETNPHFTGVPSFIFFHFLLYQLRAFHNAGFAGAIVLSGHGGAHIGDLKRVTAAFAETFDFPVWYGTDFELAGDAYPGDHAGKYEISVMMHLHPEGIDWDRAALEAQPGSGGRFALGPDAGEASAAHGARIVEACAAALGELSDKMAAGYGGAAALEEAERRALIGYDEIEVLWRRLSSQDDWASIRPREGQQPVAEQSRWKPYEYARMR
ncbi:creatininase family protein [Paenibacillus sp. IB182496]|uniref:Creatininase family protein n=1 Tax=Paenibacillus sabuli TaxID=2772509 RepID=A0A927BUR1_9BACL|nr:creatininase family protein [Paenibacillus sabuli]